VAVKLKICGLMRAPDVSRAVESGASYLGVVFAGGPRTVTPERVSELVGVSAGVPVMGVFAGQTVDEILQISERTGLSGAQLHGSYSGADAERLRGTGLTVWRVVRIAAPADLDAVSAAVAGSDAVLIEPLVPSVLGGSGVPLETAVAREARARLSGHTMVLAGGLTPETVGSALAIIRPDIVDVSSGVEAQPGIKDHDKIARFAEAVFANSSIT
jgi:phosphoribosylanthranilate isomerase